MLSENRKSCLSLKNVIDKLIVVHLVENDQRIQKGNLLPVTKVSHDKIYPKMAGNFKVVLKQKYRPKYCRFTIFHRGV